MRRNNMHRGNQPTPNIEPLMSDYLQFQKQFEYGFNHPHPAFQRQQPYSLNQNFSHYNYDPPVQQFGNFGGGLLGKRWDNGPKWQLHSAPKRFSGPQGGPMRKFGAGLSPKLDPSSDGHTLLPQCLMRQSVSNYPGQFAHNNIPNQHSQSWNKPNPQMGQKSGPRRPPPNKPLRKDFKSNKVKRKRALSPCFLNMLKCYTALQHKEIMKKTNKAKLVHKQNDSDIESSTLRPGVVPTKLLVSRLESALGKILTDIKTSVQDTEPHKASSLSPYLRRKVKQLVRKRLGTVMMNKHVGNVNLILEQYRAEFPPETDYKTVQGVQNTQKKQFVMKLVNTGSPEKYLKMNMDKLVGFALDDMFGTIQNIYENEPLENVKEAFMDILEKTDDSIADFTKYVDGDESEELESEDQNERIISNTDEIATKTEENVTETEENIEKSDVTEEEENEKKALYKSGNDDSDINIDSKDCVMLKLNKLDDIICSMIKRKIKQIIPKYKPLLLNVLNANEMYKMTCARINSKLEDKLSIVYRVKNAEKLNTSKQSLKTSESRPVNAPATSLTKLYDVKIFGRPFLPKKEVMQTFLQQFKPKSIKKHKHMHLLFVGFANKEDFDKIVALKETEIGNATIFIRTCEKLSAYGTLDDSPVDKDELIEETSTKDILIPSELDDQIDDLLSSIRKEEENANKQKVDDEVIEIN